MSTINEFSKAAIGLTSEKPHKRTKAISILFGVACVVVAALLGIILKQQTISTSQNDQAIRDHQQLINAERTTAEYKSKAASLQQEKEETIAELAAKKDALARAMVHVDQLLQDQKFNQQRITELEEANRALAEKLADATASLDTAGKTMAGQTATITELKNNLVDAQKKLSSATALHDRLEEQLREKNVLYTQAMREKAHLHEQLLAYQSVLGMRVEDIEIIKGKRSAVGENWTGTPLDAIDNICASIVESGGSRTGKEAYFAVIWNATQPCRIEISLEQMVQLKIFQEKMAANQRKLRFLEIGEMAMSDLEHVQQNNALWIAPNSSR